jgi:hypothetical protein
MVACRRTVGAAALGVIMAIIITHHMRSMTSR